MTPEQKQTASLFEKIKRQKTLWFVAAGVFVFLIACYIILLYLCIDGGNCGKVVDIVWFGFFGLCLFYYFLNLKWEWKDK